jgi:hypothetical protein
MCRCDLIEAAVPTPQPQRTLMQINLGAASSAKMPYGRFDRCDLGGTEVEAIA